MEETTAKGKAKRIPYGMMNFVAVREDDCYYVDKTRFIQKVEDANKFFFFNRPLHEIFTDMEHSYIIELKYLNSKATDAQVSSAIEQAKSQVCRYADTVNAKQQIGTTTLHKVYVVYRGVEMVACEEVVKQK